jgi:N-acetylmuramoyl-L-alanine amidase
LRIVYPWVDAHFAPLHSLFVFGSTEPGAHVWVDDVPASIAPDGAWIAFIPVPSGTFTLRVVSRREGSQAQADRVVTVDAPSMSPSSPAITTLRENGWVIPYSPDPESGFRPYGMLAPAPYADTEFTLPVGTPVSGDEKSGNYLRVALGAGGRWWIDRHEVGTSAPNLAPRSFRSTRLFKHASGRWVTYTLELARRIPFRIFEHPDSGSLTLTLYTAESARSLTLTSGASTLWGYRSGWNGDDLVVAVRKPPSFAAPPRPALAGLLIVIDAGHSPDTGAIGPMGTIERDINLDIALRLRSRLQALGARVLMTRTDASPVKLYDRPALAERIGADILISVHNNAPPDGVDPSTDHGFTVYYFYPHSLALARSVHAAYLRHTNLPDLGVRSGDFALVRSSQLPSILTESAFITWPWEEMQLRDPSFRDRLALTMTDGLERWAESVRSR